MTDGLMDEGVAGEADLRCAAVLYIGGEAIRCVRVVELVDGKRQHPDRHKYTGRTGEAKASVLGHWAIVWDQE